MRHAFDNFIIKLFIWQSFNGWHYATILTSLYINSIVNIKHSYRLNISLFCFSGKFSLSDELEMLGGILQCLFSFYNSSVTRRYISYLMAVATYMSLISYTFLLAIDDNIVTDSLLSPISLNLCTLIVTTDMTDNQFLLETLFFCFLLIKWFWLPLIKTQVSSIIICYITVVFEVLVLCHVQSSMKDIRINGV